MLNAATRLADSIAVHWFDGTAVPSVADNLCSAGSHLQCNTAQYCHEKYKENTTFHSTGLVFPDIIKYSKKK